MREEHRHLAIDLGIAAIVEFLDGVCTVEWTGQVLVIMGKDVIERLIT